MENLIQRGFRQLYSHEHNNKGYDQPGHILDSAVAERMLVVGRLAGHLKAQKADDAGASVGQVIDAVGNNRNRAGQKPRGDFGGAEQGVAENTHNAAYHAVSLPHSRAFHVRRVGNKVFYEEISQGMVPPETRDFVSQFITNRWFSQGGIPLSVKIPFQGVKIIAGLRAYQGSPKRRR